MEQRRAVGDGYIGGIGELLIRYRWHLTAPMGEMDSSSFASGFVGRQRGVERAAAVAAMCRQ